MSIIVEIFNHIKVEEEQFEIGSSCAFHRSFDRNNRDDVLWMLELCEIVEKQINLGLSHEWPYPISSLNWLGEELQNDLLGIKLRESL